MNYKLRVEYARHLTRAELLHYHGLGLLDLPAGREDDWLAGAHTQAYASHQVPTRLGDPFTWPIQPEPPLCKPLPGGRLSCGRAQT
jgi:hypothetical protein